MLYIARIDDREDGGESYYYMFETHTESLIYGNLKLATELLTSYKMEAKNFCIANGEIKIKQWPHKIKKSSEIRDSVKYYILLTDKNKQQFKLVNVKGVVRYCSSNELRDLIEDKRIANCTYDKNSGYKSIDTYTIPSSIKFEKRIELKYNEFRAKTTMLGLDTNFKYIIEGKDVKLVSYTGASKKVILPGFITTICKRAFKAAGVIEIILNNGLKYIGNEAFMGNELSHVEIPSSVNFIGRMAFHNNSNELMGLDKYDRKAVNVLNSKALIMDKLD